MRSAMWHSGRKESCWSPSRSVGDEVGVVELEQDVPVAQHGPLGRPGGAGGVDEDGQVVGPGDLDHARRRRRDAPGRNARPARGGPRTASPARRGSRAGPPCRRRRSSRAAGSAPRTSRILSSCSSFSAKKNRVPLSLTMYSTWRGGVGGVDAVGDPAHRQRARSV